MDKHQSFFVDYRQRQRQFKLMKALISLAFASPENVVVLREMVPPQKSTLFLLH